MQRVSVVVTKMMILCDVDDNNGWRKSREIYKWFDLFCYVACWHHFLPWFDSRLTFFKYIVWSLDPNEYMLLTVHCILYYLLTRLCRWIAAGFCHIAYTVCYRCQTQYIHTVIDSTTSLGSQLLTTHNPNWQEFKYKKGMPGIQTPQILMGL